MEREPFLSLKREKNYIATISFISKTTTSMQIPQHKNKMISVKYSPTLLQQWAIQNYEIISILTEDYVTVVAKRIDTGRAFQGLEAKHWLVWRPYKAIFLEHKRGHL